MIDQEFEAYFYNGFEKPKLIANTIRELSETAIVEHYQGDVTTDFLDAIERSTSISKLTSEMAYFNIYINPTLETFHQVNQQWFNKEDINTNLKNFN